MPDLRWTQLAALARRQHGLASTSQIRVIGYSEQELRTLVSKGFLTRIERGVYRASGHGPRWRATLLAHCWATGGRAFATSAALVHGLGSPSDLSPGFAEVVVPTVTRPRKRCRLSTHRSARWDQVHTVEIDRIPCLPLGATLVSLAMHHPYVVFRAVANEARRQKRITIDDLDAAAEPFLLSGVRHSRILRSALDRFGGSGDLPLSDWSDEFADWCRASGFPAPHLEFRIVDNDGVLIAQVDVCWPGLKVVVELDSWAWHHDLASFNRDRSRYRRLTAAGWTVFAITWDQWMKDRSGIARDLAAALGAPDPLA